MHWIVALSLLLGAEASEEKVPTPDPLSAYHQTNIRGWDVYVHKSLMREDKETGDAALELIDHQLYDIQRRLPKDAVVQIQKIPIWLEQDNTHANPCACYHVSEDWLGKNGFLREKAKAVEISSAKTFLQWCIAQPYMLMHEMAHGYHDRVLGYDDARVVAAFEQAKKSGTYEEVLHINGKKKSHYAIENEREYFAEGTEAMFGTNDFYPFVKSEFKQHDPEGFRVIEMLWNQSKDDESKPMTDAAKEESDD
ncbi:hypothetical protein AB1L30_19565 [Bremerella sp. JC817]|uniref:hypothetical protein n=1 Tax=Bremerella sp. JC817 TaxID=3231756 RepID=UPI00345923A3